MTNPRTLRRYLVWVLAVAVVVMSAQLFAGQPKDAKAAHQAKTETHGTTAQFVGSDEQCKACHEDQFKNVQATPHFTTITKTGQGERWQGCESCHGPGSEHVANGGDKTKIFTFKDVKAEEITRNCLTCHSTNLEHQNFTRSAHNKAGVSCTSCHAIHQPAEAQKLLVQKSPNLCFSCHNETRADFNKPYRHRVLEGYVTCSDCHNVHGTTLPRQVRGGTAQDSGCFKCHADKRGPFVFEHEPVRVEGCSTCHTPHGSTNPRLLTRSRVNSMCLECHQAIPAGPHPQNTKSQACTLCHSQIHGSNVSEVFFK